ncbi:hypothetical protein [Vibrio cholerae]|uniref:hypothetical protein n=1 Tax=Vibrio cholerae TaxID=666 RepID=UPI00301B5988
MFELIKELLDNPIFTGIFGVLIGALLGHRLALGRDKRKEYNEVVVPLKSAIQKEANNPRPFIIDSTLVNAVQFKIPPSHYRKLTNEYQKYTGTMTKAIYSNDWGEPQLNHQLVPQIVQSLNNMDSLLKVR